jgi:hypothetical protein
MSRLVPLLEFNRKGVVKLRQDSPLEVHDAHHGVLHGALRKALTGGTRNNVFCLSAQHEPQRIGVIRGTSAQMPKPRLTTSSSQSSRAARLAIILSTPPLDRFKIPQWPENLAAYIPEPEI